MIELRVAHWDQPLNDTMAAEINLLAPRGVVVLDLSTTANLESWITTYQRITECNAELHAEGPKLVTKFADAGYSTAHEHKARTIIKALWDAGVRPKISLGPRWYPTMGTAVVDYAVQIGFDEHWCRHPNGGLKIYDMTTGANSNGISERRNPNVPFEDHFDACGKFFADDGVNPLECRNGLMIASYYHDLRKHNRDDDGDIRPGGAKDRLVRWWGHVV